MEGYWLADHEKGDGCLVNCMIVPIIDWYHFSKIVDPQQKTDQHQWCQCCVCADVQRERERGVRSVVGWLWLLVAKERARWAARSNKQRAASQAPTLAAAPSQGDPQCHNARTILFHCKGSFQNIRLAGWDALKEVDLDSLQWIAIRRGPVLVPGSW